MTAVWGDAIEHLWRGAVKLRSAAWDQGLLTTYRVGGVAVLSVGGLRIGGEGKTPMALHLAKMLHSKGAPTAIVSRGYRGRWENRGGVVATGRGGPLAAPCDGGDEATLVAMRAPELTVVVGADRVRAVRRARDLGARAVVLDSGFQHRRLARDLDLVVAGWPLEDTTRCLPLGPLREPVTALSRADLLGWEFSGEDPSPPLEGRDFSFELVPTSLVDEELVISEAPEALDGVRLVLVTGIARPERVDRHVAALGGRVVARHRFRDHHPFRARDRRAIARSVHRHHADLVVTTEKDLLRLGSIDGIDVRGLRVDVAIRKGGQVLEQAIERFLERVPR